MAAGAQRARRLDPHQVVRGRGHRALFQRFALRPAHQIALVRLLRRQQIAGVLVGRIHQRVFPGLEQDGDDRVIEERVRNLHVASAAHARENRIGLKARGAQHGDQQAGLVAANAVLLLEGEAYVVGFEAGPVLFRRHAHVADGLGDVIEKSLGPIHAGGPARGELGDLFPQLGRHRVEVGLREVPVPPRNSLPVGQRAHPQALQDDLIRRHRGLVIHARDVVDLPGVHMAAVVGGAAGGRHRAGNLIADRDLLEVLRRRRRDLDAQVADEAPAFEQAALGVFPVDDRAHDRLPRDGVDQVARGKLRDVHLENARVGVIDVDLHLLVVDRLL